MLSQQFPFSSSPAIAATETVTEAKSISFCAAAMKAFALGRRSKWKDYIDLFFILRSHYDLPQISEQARMRFGDLFSEKLFRGQLNYFKGISLDEQVEFMPGFEVSEEEVKNFLTDAALTGF